MSLAPGLLTKTGDSISVLEKGFPKVATQKKGEGTFPEGKIPVREIYKGVSLTENRKGPKRLPLGPNHETPYIVRAALIEGSIPPLVSRERVAGPMFQNVETKWDDMVNLFPISGMPVEGASAEWVIDTKIKIGNPGIFISVKILVDSGSRVGILFRRGLFQNLVPAKRPIKMCTATGEPLPGGSMGAHVVMALPILVPKENDSLQEENFKVGDWGYEGAIGGGRIDILLGYPVLSQYGIAILPRLDCLSLDTFAGTGPTKRPASVGGPASLGAAVVDR